MNDGTATATRTMTAWRQLRYGGPEAVRAETIPVPMPRRGEVLVRLDASSINSGDIHLMRGEPRMVRLFFGLRRPRVAGRGMDLAGTIVARGADAADLVIGDRVVGAHNDALAEYIAVPAKRLSRIPAEVSSTDAATLPIANTAITILDRCRVGAESRVLVIGAGGGVGTLTVQLAAERGAEVWATCGARAEQTLQRLGATRTFDYRTTDLAALPAGTFDAVVDIAGEPPLTLLRGLLRNGGSVALVGGEGGRVLGPLPRMVRAMLATRRGRAFRSIAAVTRTAVTAQLLELAASGRLTPVIEQTFPLADARSALAHVDAGHTLGKVVIEIGTVEAGEAGEAVEAGAQG
jgi:NADPH:quinone reductase-like Zn-dependent oxidoreductase